MDLPLDVLGLALLRDYLAANQWSIGNYLGDLRKHLSLSEDAQFALSEAVGWLYANGLIADKPVHLSGGQFVTRTGKRVLSEGPQALRAARRLDVELHPRLERTRTQFLLGEYELSAFAAMRAVEIRTRELSKLDAGLIGTRLMTEAFRPAGNDKPPGPLTDTTSERGEQQGMMMLFSGAIAVFKNPVSHRQVDYNDPTEASEVVLLADLLLRMLDRTVASPKS